LGLNIQGQMCINHLLRQLSLKDNDNTIERDMKMMEITCIECGDKFNKFQGNMEERTCMTCILKNEDPEVISEPYGNYLSDRDKLNI